MMKWIDEFNTLLITGILSIVLAVLIAAILVAIFRPSPCASAESIECIEHRMDECLQSEMFSRQECIVLIGGGK